jgi:glyoxylase-like metal-dependent hydrolase (beta-lactamase superfamily II)
MVSRVEVLHDYTGHVVPGGPAIRRDLDWLSIVKVSVGPMDNNAYLLVDQATREALLVDAANEPDRIMDLVVSWPDRLELRMIVTTHRHPDHWQALGAVVDMSQALTVTHPLAAPALPVQTDVLVEHGDWLILGNTVLEVIHLRGHTPGSIALLYRGTDRPHLFTGDSLFPWRPGWTTNPPDSAMLMNDLDQCVFGPLPDDTWIYPGHGDDSTLGTERPHLSKWRARGE